MKIEWEHGNCEYQMHSRHQNFDLRYSFIQNHVEIFLKPEPRGKEYIASSKSKDIYKFVDFSKPFEGAYLGCCPMQYLKETLEISSFFGHECEVELHGSFKKKEGDAPADTFHVSFVDKGIYIQWKLCARGAYAYGYRIVIDERSWDYEYRKAFWSLKELLEHIQSIGLKGIDDGNRKKN